MIDAVLFDLDGTLVDTPQAITEVIATVMSRIEAKPRAAATIRATIGRPLDVAFSELMSVAINSTQVADAVKEYQSIFSDTILPRASSLIFPGVVAGLDELRSAGVTLAIATSKIHKSADLLLESSGIHDFFSQVVGADEVANPKPASDIAQKLLLDLQITAENVVMVGDTVHDLKMAQGAKIRTIAVTYGVDSAEALSRYCPDYLASSFDQVVEFLLNQRRPYL